MFGGNQSLNAQIRANFGLERASNLRAQSQKRDLKNIRNEGLKKSIECKHRLNWPNSGSYIHRVNITNLTDLGRHICRPKHKPRGPQDWKKINLERQYWNNQAFNTECNFHSNGFFNPNPSLAEEEEEEEEEEGPGLKCSSENENFKPRMKLSSENGSFVRGGMVFSCVRARINVFDLWAPWEWYENCREKETQKVQK